MKLLFLSLKTYIARCGSAAITDLFRFINNLKSALRSFNQWIRCASFILVITIFLPSLSEAKDCSTYRSAYKDFHTHSVFVLPKENAAFRLKVWSDYLEFLDPNKLYFRAGDAEQIRRKYEHLDVSSLIAVCQAIEHVGELLSHRVDDVARLLPSLLNTLAHNRYQLAKDSRMVVDTEHIPYAGGDAQIAYRWQRRLVYERLKLAAYSQKKARDFIEDYFLEHHKIMNRKIYWYNAFIKSLFLTLDPYFAYRMPPKVSPSAHAIKDARHSLTYRLIDFAFMLPYVRYEGRNFFPHFLEMRWLSHKKKSFGIPNANFLQNGDKIINLLDFDQNPFALHYLKKTYEGYEWYKLTKSIDVKAYAQPFHLFYRKFNIVKEAEPSQHGLLEDTKVPKPLGSKESTREVGLAYLYFGNVFSHENRGKHDFAPLSTLLHERLQQLSTKMSLPTTTLIIDLRGSSLGNIPFLMNIIAPFLSYQPIVRVQDRTGEIRVYASNKAQRRYAGALVLLVNSRTAKLSEIMAASLQEYGRALIVGEGLGSSTAGINVKHRLRTYNNALHSLWRFGFSDHFYYTAGGRFLGGKGLVPDITLPLEVDLPSTEHLRTKYGHDYPSLPRIQNLEPLPGLCFSPLPPDLISELRHRSQQRLLKRVYPRLVLQEQGGQKKVQQVWLSFQVAFHMTSQQLKAAVPPSCDHPHCGSVSLELDDYLKDHPLFDELAQRIQHSAADDTAIFQQFPELAAEDPVLLETLHIAADYGRHLRGLPYASLDLFSSHKKSLLHRRRHAAE